MAAAITQPTKNRQPGFMDQVSAEWTKLSSLRATYIQVLLAIAITVIVTALTTIFGDASNWSDLSLEEQTSFDPTRISLMANVFSTIILTILGVMLISSEYTSGMIRLTFASTPHRPRVLFAKALVVLGVTLFAGFFIAFGSFFVGQTMLGSYEDVPTASLSDGDTLRAVFSSWLTTPVFPLIGAALAAILRSTASAITAGLGLIFAPVIVGGLLPDWWDENVLAYFPGNASDMLKVTYTDISGYIEPTFAVVALIVWLVGFFGVAHVLLQRRDA